VLAQRDVCPFRLCWSDQYRLIVAMGSNVQCCHIRRRRNPPSAQEQLSGLPEYEVVILKSFTVEDMFVCGAAPYGTGKYFN